MDTESFSIQGARMLYIKTSRKIRSKNKDMVFFDAAAEVL